MIIGNTPLIKIYYEYWFNFAFLLLVVICVPVLNNAKKQEVELVIIFLTEQTPVSVK